jgi:hypothetical protein
MLFLLKQMIFKIGLWGFCCLGLLSCCDNPFFPRTGEPLTGNAGRKTPAGVIEQLYRAYETRQLSLYLDLFSKRGDFRFYVSPAFEADYVSTTTNANVELIDSSFSYAYIHVRDKRAYYWSYNEEIQKTSKLFSQAIDIHFTQTPQAIDTASIVYFRAQDGMDYAEVVTRDGQMDITVSSDQEYFVNDYILDMGVQVFYLTRDPNDPALWVIAKWFDLGTANGVP